MNFGGNPRQGGGGGRRGEEGGGGRGDIVQATQITKSRARYNGWRRDQEEVKEREGQRDRKLAYSE